MNDILVKIDMTGEGEFRAITGLKVNSINLSAESVDVTSLESAGGWREIMGGAGIKSVEISGSGVFQDAASDKRVRQIFVDGETPDFHVVIPDFGTIKGAFQVVSIEYSGGLNEWATYALLLSSAGRIFIHRDENIELIDDEKAEKI